MKNDPIQSALGRLDEIPLRTPEGPKQIAKALASKSNLVAAKAARIAGEAQWAELTDELVAAFQRFLKRAIGTRQRLRGTDRDRAGPLRIRLR